MTGDRFPPNTRGFAYYHTPPKAPPFVGELRFRCASNLDDFHNGKDLMLKDNFTPWSIPLNTLAISYAYLREQLILDNLVTQATMDKWATAWNVVPDSMLGRTVKRDRPVLYYFTQPFLFRFDSRRIAFYTATKDEIRGCDAHSPLKERRHHHDLCPYGGSGLVRLEPYLNPKRPDKDQVALRVLKIIEPVKALLQDYDGYVRQPTEGALIQRSNIGFPVASFRLEESLKGMAILPLNFDDLP